jgi:predicted nuclease of predicted toxin-antitoxin system
MSQLLPEFFVDHCLGTKQFPEFLRNKGFEAKIMMSEFGRSDVQDTEWIEAIGKNNWIVFTKDAAIRRRTAERNAVIKHNLRVFCLVHQQLSFVESTSIFESNWTKLEKWFFKPGPWIVAVRKSGIEEVPLSKAVE